MVACISRGKTSYNGLTAAADSARAPHGYSSIWINFGTVHTEWRWKVKGLSTKGEQKAPLYLCTSETKTCKQTEMTTYLIASWWCIIHFPYEGEGRLDTMHTCLFNESNVHIGISKFWRGFPVHCHGCYSLRCESATPLVAALHGL